MKQKFPLIDPKELLEPVVIVMPVGIRNPQPHHAIIYSQREYEYLQQFKTRPVTVEVKLKNDHK